MVDGVSLRTAIDTAWSVWAATSQRRRGNLDSPVVAYECAKRSSEESLFGPMSSRQ
jgi:hypothetical protein